MSVLGLKQAIAGGVVLLTIVLTIYLRKSNKGPKLEPFPGPKQDFIIGNIRQFPRSHWAEVFGAWKDEYGAQ